MIFIFIFFKSADSGLFMETFQFIQQINVKNGHPVSSADLRTHDLLNTCLLPWPLDQGSSPNCLSLCVFVSITVSNYIVQLFPILFFIASSVRWGEKVFTIFVSKSAYHTNSYFQFFNFETTSDQKFLFARDKNELFT